MILAAARIYRLPRRNRQASFGSIKRPKKWAINAVIPRVPQLDLILHASYTRQRMLGVAAIFNTYTYIIVDLLTPGLTHILAGEFNGTR
jgi:hypothetical protein